MSDRSHQVAYAAGVVDSDGYIGVHKAHGPEARAKGWQITYQPRVQVKQVTPDAIELLLDLFGGHRYGGKPTAKRGRPLITWAVHSATAGRVCEELLPFLRIKRQQAENALEVCRLNNLPRRHVLPAVDPGEPMVTMAEAARITGRTFNTVSNAVYQGSLPHVRTGPRKVLIPVSFLDVWMTRKEGGAPRSAETTAALEECFARSKVLNHVGI